jgi:hypothetical protein
MTSQTLEPTPGAGAEAPAPEITTPIVSAPTPVLAAPAPACPAPRASKLSRGDWWPLIAFLVCALWLVAYHLWDLVAGLFFH